MDIFTNEEIVHIIKQRGYTKALHWSVKNYSDEVLGYLGEHLTLTIQVEPEKELKFFVKCLPRNDKWKAKYLKEHGFFKKEYTMLHCLFEKFEQGSEKWRPAVFFAKEDLFVFEDVVLLGYAMCKRDRLSLEEVKACIATMARFHVKSYIYEEKRSQVLNRPYRIWEDYSNYLQEPNRNQKWRKAGMNAVIDFLKVHSKFKHYKNFSKNIESTIPKLFEDSLSLMKPHSTYRNVVVHRDLWMNNIFLKNGSNQTHALFVDFQTVIYCPPMLDLTSFLYFNTRRDFRDRYLDELIDFYYSILEKELKKDNNDFQNVINKESMHKCYNDSLKFGIVQASLIVPISLINKMKDINNKLFCNPEKVSHFYEVSRSEEILEIARSDKRYRNHVIELLDEIVERFIYPTV